MEVPIPWKVTVCPYKINQTMRKFLEENIEAVISGDERGHTIYKEYEQDLEARKRDLKAKYKEDREKIPKEEIAKYDRNLWKELEEIYCLTLRRFLLEPSLFVQTHEEISTSHFVVLLKNFHQLQKLFDNAQLIRKPIPQYE